MYIYRNIYIKQYSYIPTSLLKGSLNILYYGKIYFNVNKLPKDYNNKSDIYYKVDCDFSDLKSFQYVNKKIK